MTLAPIIRRLGALALLPAILAGCSMRQDIAKPLTDKQSIALAKALDGKVAGAPQNCLPLATRSDLQVISDSVLLYKEGRRTVYRNDVIGQCNGLAQDGIPVIQSFGGQQCRGDIIRVVDRTSGFGRGSCALGDFVPYTAPAAKGR